MQNANYYLNPDFQDKVKFYLFKYAITVMAEANTVDYHAERAAYAEKVLNGLTSIDAYALGVSTNPTIKTHIDANTDYDNDIEYVVNTIFTAYAGGTAV